MSQSVEKNLRGSSAAGRGSLVAFVGTYGHGLPVSGGGITVFDVSCDGRRLTSLSHVDEPKEAGYLVYSTSLKTLYAVDERKNDGRGPVEPAARVHAFAVNQHNGSLSWLNSQPAPGPRPTFLSIDDAKLLLVTANHGDFEHVEHVVRTSDEKWTIEYLYDDSTVIMYGLEPDGRLGDIRDVQVFEGHGKDPNTSPQARGHSQASAHAHCAVFDPTGNYVLVCDKGTDRIFVFRVGRALELISTLQFAEQTAPRHLRFDPISGRVLATFELSSELGSFDFNASSGELRLLDKRSTVDHAFKRDNEPADLRIHPKGGFVYVINRGEDSLAWFRLGHGGELSRLGQVFLAKSVHPGLAARSFAFDPSGSFMLVADRPANLIRSYSVDAQDGSLHALTEAPIQAPAFIAFAELPTRA
jgi:6-phosphogluconolactonase